MIVNAAVGIASILAAVWLNTGDALVASAFPPVEVEALEGGGSGTAPNPIRVALQILLLALAGDQLIRVVRSMGRS